jgi:hypothetical protein
VKVVLFDFMPKAGGIVLAMMIEAIVWNEYHGFADGSHDIHCNVVDESYHHDYDDDHRRDNVDILT